MIVLILVPIWFSLSVILIRKGLQQISGEGISTIQENKDPAEYTPLIFFLKLKYKMDVQPPPLSLWASKGF